MKNGFTPIPNEAVDQLMPIVGGVAFSVYVALCRLSDAGGSCYPTHRKLAGMTRFSPRCIRDCLQVLSVAGLVVVEECGKNRGKANVYRVLTPLSIGEGRQQVPTLEQDGRQQVPTGSAAGAYRVGTTCLPGRQQVPNDSDPITQTQLLRPNYSEDPPSDVTPLAAEPEQLSLIPIHSEKPKPSDPVTEWFNEIWPIYPNKASRKGGLKAALALKPSRALREQITAHVSAMLGSEQWKKDGGRWAPYFSSYIHGEKWNDPVPTHSSANSKLPTLTAEEQRQEWRRKYPELMKGAQA